MSRKIICSIVIILLGWQSLRLIFGSDIITGNDIYTHGISRLDQLYNDFNDFGNDFLVDLRDLQKKAEISLPFDEFDQTVEDEFIVIHVDPDSGAIDKIFALLKYIAELLKSLINTIVKIVNGTISAGFDFAISSFTFIKSLLWFFKLIFSLLKFLID